MIIERSYKTSFIAAVLLHLSIIIFLVVDTNSQRPVLVKAKDNVETNVANEEEIEKKQEQQAIQAVSVDSKEVMEEMNRIQVARNAQKQAEINKQRLIEKNALEARKKLIAEQNKIAALKKEANQLAILKAKQLADAKKKQEQLDALNKAQEKRMAEIKENNLKIKKQQELEAKKLADLKNKQNEELLKAAKIEAEHKASELAKQQQAIKDKQLALEAMQKAQMAGVVDKYKALIINAISRQWILPENANSSMSSQFRIRLAPNGTVLDVNLIRSSGDAILDRSARAAIYKASPLQVPSDANAFNLFRDISLTVRPVNARG